MLSTEQPKGVPEFQNWREFSSQAGHFKVMLPRVPQHVTDKITDPKTKEPRKYDTFVAGDENGPAYMISAITNTKGDNEEASEDTLKQIVNEMLARNKDNKLNKMELNRFREFKALDFSMTNGEIIIAGKVFSHGDTVYVLSMINKSKAYNPQELDFFINSFDVLNSGVTAPGLIPKKP